MSSTRRSSLQLSGRKKSQDKHTGLYQVARLEHSELACVPPQVPSHSMAAGPESSKVHPQAKLLKLYITCELNCLFNKADVVECRQVSWPKLSESTSAPIFFGSEFSFFFNPKHQELHFHYLQLLSRFCFWVLRAISMLCSGHFTWLGKSKEDRLWVQHGHNKYLTRKESHLGGQDNTAP